MRLGVETAPSTALPTSLWDLIARVRTGRSVQDRSFDAAEAPLSIEERRGQLVTFYAMYEDLIETLCDAAQYGPAVHLERQYARCRRWMIENYAPLRRFLCAYLHPTQEDAVIAEKFRFSGADAFEALIAPPTLADFLAHDDGMMISRMHRSREALTLYGNHLRTAAQQESKAN